MTVQDFLNKWGLHQFRSEMRQDLESVIADVTPSVSDEEIDKIAGAIFDEILMSDVTPMYHDVIIHTIKKMRSKYEAQ